MQEIERNPRILLEKQKWEANYDSISKYLRWFAKPTNMYFKRALEMNACPGSELMIQAVHDCMLKSIAIKQDSYILLDSVAYKF